MNEVEYDSMETVALHVTAKAGTSIGEAMRDAIRLASTEWRNVTLVFNGLEYRVLVNDLLQAVRLPKPVARPDDPAPAQNNAIAWEMRARELKVYLREILSWRVLQGTMADKDWNPMQEVREKAGDAVGMRNNSGDNAIWDAK